MANEFIARKGLVVLSNGAKVTGSLGVQGDINATGYNVTASNLQLFGSASIDGDLTINGNLTLGNEDIDVVKFLAEVSSSIVPDVNNAFDLGSGSKSWKDLYVSGTAYIDTVQANTINLDSITVLSDLTVEGNTILGNQVTDSVKVTGSVEVLGPINATSISGSFSGSGAQITNIPNSGLDNSDITVTAGSGLTQGGTVSLGGSVTVALDTGSATFNDGVKSKLNTDGIFSSSIQTDVRDTTGITTIATTGSNTFTGVQTITNTTNSTNFTEGALIVQGGVGIAKDVNISGSLQVLGLLTAVSMSTQYVTSSQYVVGTSRVIVNDDDLVRFAGLTVIDSGSTYGTGSILWDSLNNHWIFEVDDENYNSTIAIGGPKHSGSPGSEVGLTTNRVPVATDTNHIDSRLESSSIRVDFPSRLTHVEAGLVVTGSVTSSVGFSGDGSQLTGIVTELALTGSDGGTGTVSLKTQALTVDGTNGLTATVSGQTITISGSNATTSSIGVASFNATNFSVAGGEVTSNNITLNNTNVTLGGTRNITLQEITQYGGTTTTDQVTLNGGAVIHGVLFTSGSNLDVDTGTETIASIPTGSFDAAHFDYVVKQSGNLRTGTVMVVWQSGTTNIEFTDTSTNDLGNTSEVIFTADTLDGNVRLRATVDTMDWSIKTAVRAL
jgi:hypothetical protein